MENFKNDRSQLISIENDNLIYESCSGLDGDYDLYKNRSIIMRDHCYKLKKLMKFYNKMLIRKEVKQIQKNESNHMQNLISSKRKLANTMIKIAIKDMAFKI